MSTVRTHDLTTDYERRGDGPPVVFVHAAMLDHSMWDAQVDALDADYTTVAYDMRGHGRTGGSQMSAYSTERYVEDLRALVTGLELDNPVVCGLSTGGLVAMAYAAAYPDDVSGVVLADAFTPTIRTRGEWFLRRVVFPGLVYPARLVGFERVERAQVWLTERFFGGASGDYENVERLREAGPGMSTGEFVKVIRWMARSHREPVDLAAISVPTLVLYGEKELPFVVSHVAEVAARVPDVRVVEIPAAGHASNLDAPEAFTAAVRDFLGRVRPVESRVE